MLTANGQALIQMLEAMSQKYQALGESLGDPKVLADTQRYRQIAKERSELTEIVDGYQEYLKLLGDIRSSEGILCDPRSDPELKQLASGELKALQEKSRRLEDRLVVMLLPRDPRDEKNTFLEIRAGTGGGEAALFASELVRMYTRYAERRGWRVEMMSSSPTGIGGLKEAILLVEGKRVYNRLKY